MIFRSELHVAPIQLAARTSLKSCNFTRLDFLFPFLQRPPSHATRNITIEHFPFSPNSGPHLISFHIESSVATYDSRPASLPFFPPSRANNSADVRTGSRGNPAIPVAAVSNLFTENSRNRKSACRAPVLPPVGEPGWEVARASCDMGHASAEICDRRRLSSRSPA